MLSDVKHALRALRRSPGFTLVAVLCLGLGLGANTTIYSFVNAMLLRPLPYRAPERLVALRLTNRQTGSGAAPLSMPYLLDVRARSRTLAGVAGWAGRTVALAERDGAAAVDAAVVSAEFFDVLGVRPFLGRAFRAEESAPGAERVAVVTESFWRERLGGDASAVGRAITLDGVPTTVVGVMPDHVGITGDREALWVPAVHDPDPAQRANLWLGALARLREGVTPEQLRDDLARIGAELAAEHPAAYEHWAPRAERLHESFVPDEVALVFGIMMGAVGCVLLIACANVANLVLARAAGRGRELAVRSSLGATRWRVVRLVLVESVAVALAGGAVGVAIAYAATGALRSNVPVAYPAWIVFDVDLRVLAYALALSAGTGLLFGLVPALRATRPALAPTLRDGSRTATVGNGGRRLRDGLVVVELALSLALLAGAGLMVKSVLRLQSADLGFRPEGVLAARVYLGGERYAGAAVRGDVMRRARERLSALPGAGQVEAISSAPLAGGGSMSTFVLDGAPLSSGERPTANAQWRPVSSGALSLLGVPLVAGRWLTDAEALDSASTAVVINETMARRHWPNATPVGRRIAVAPAGDSSRASPRWLTVVGVARDVKLFSADRRPENQVWRPWATAAGRSLTLLVRGAGAAAADPAALAPSVRRALGEADAMLPVEDLSTMPSIVQGSFWLRKLYGFLFGCFAAAALALAVVGVYGVVSYQVAQRLREFGVRVALGASAADLYRLVLGQGARLAGVGLAAGLALALAVTRLLSSVLVGVSATDPVVFAAVSATLAGAALLATYVPARRATRANPTDVLRAE